MSNYSKTLVLGSVLAAATMASSAALADVTANIGVTSNYLWRGVTQTANESAVSGGLDYSHESGAYIGTWVSSLGGYQYENDVYLGYAGEASDISYDIGYILYRYPVDKDIEADLLSKKSFLIVHPHLNISQSEKAKRASSAFSISTPR